MTRSFRNRWSRRRLVGLVLVSIAMIVVLRGCFFRPATKAKPSTVTGVALYAHWDTDSTEWEIYESLWLGH